MAGRPTIPRPPIKVEEQLPPGAARPETTYSIIIMAVSDEQRI